MRPDYVLDANLIVLLVVGLTDPNEIGRHKRLSGYDVRDFEILKSVLLGASRIIFTPNALTEASNLLGHGDDLRRKRFASTLAAIVEKEHEEWMPARQAVERRELLRLGLTDAVLLSLASSGGSLLTADLPLYLAAAAAGCDTVNFDDLRRTQFEI